MSISFQYLIWTKFYVQKTVWDTKPKCQNKEHSDYINQWIDYFQYMSYLTINYLLCFDVLLKFGKDGGRGTRDNAFYDLKYMWHGL